MNDNNDNTEETGKAFERLYKVVRRLREPDGCPWDREQTPQTLRETLVEESYELIEAIDDWTADPSKGSAHVCEELGDVFLQPEMIAYMFEQKGGFSVADALNGLCDKLIRRHPHVFGDVKVKDSAEVLRNWDKIKVEQEGRKPKDSILDTVHRGLPVLDKAFKLQKKAAKVGFDWSCKEDVSAKVEEELGEVNAAAQEGNKEHVEEELGDLLFSVVNLCRYLDVEPSVALQRTNVKFTRRFKYVEQKMKQAGKEMVADASASIENMQQMDAYWNEAKALP
jgi:tetrapyrrole methylase family protein/MazG family protein